MKLGSDVSQGGPLIWLRWKVRLVHFRYWGIGWVRLEFFGNMGWCWRSWPRRWWGGRSRKKGENETWWMINTGFWCFWCFWWFWWCCCCCCWWWWWWHDWSKFCYDGMMDDPHIPWGPWIHPKVIRWYFSSPLQRWSFFFRVSCLRSMSINQLGRFGFMQLHVLTL